MSGWSCLLRLLLLAAAMALSGCEGTTRAANGQSVEHHQKRWERAEELVASALRKGSKWDAQVARAEMRAALEAAVDSGVLPPEMIAERRARLDEVTKQVDAMWGGY